MKKTYGIPNKVKSSMTFPIVRFCLIVVIYGSVLATALTIGHNISLYNSLNRPLIVQVSGDDAVTSATNILKENLNEFRIIHVRSVEDLQSEIGSNIAIFFVGHGSSEGIGTPSSMILSWMQIQHYLNSYLEPKSYIIACNAQQSISRYGLESFGTSGTVDAEIGAYLGLIKFLCDFNTYSEAYEILNQAINLILTKPISQYQTLGLYIVGHLSMAEGLYWLAIALTILLIGLFPGLGAMSPTKLSQIVTITAVSMLAVASAGVFFWNLVWFVEGQMTPEYFFSETLEFILQAIFKFSAEIPKHLSWWELLIFGTTILATIAIWVGSSSAVMIAQLVLISAVLITAVWSYQTDYYDTGLKVGYDEYDSGGGGSGGGCVAKGTKILLADGKHSKKVQRLKIGDWVLGYNISSGETVPVQVTNNIEEEVSSLLEIVHERGKLKVTPVNQPIYMRNASYTGWLKDPQNLKIGDQIFHVPTQSWVKVLNFKSKTGHFKVYDVVTDPLNVFVGNGILLDRK